MNILDKYFKYFGYCIYSYIRWAFLPFQNDPDMYVIVVILLEDVSFSLLSQLIKIWNGLFTHTKKLSYNQINR